MPLIVAILQLTQLFENSMGFMYAMVIIDAGFSQIQLGFLLAIPAAVGFIFDVWMSRFTAKTHWQSILRISLWLAVLFTVLLYLAAYQKSFGLFLASGIVWYIYYELFCLSQQQYVIQEFTKNNFSKIWGILYTVMQLGWVVGPILGAVALKYIGVNTLLIHAALVILLQIIMTFVPKSDKKEERFIHETQNSPKSHVSYLNLFRTILPVAGAYVLALLVTEMFQNIGGLFGESLTSGREWSWIVISVFSLALVIGPFLLSKYAINSGKKYTALLFLILGGGFLFVSYFINSLGILLLALFLAGLCISVALPLEEAVFSDFEKRSTHERAQLLTIVRLVASVAYVISPLIGGFMSENFGFKSAFAALGLGVMIFAVILRLMTPRKIKIPHTA